MSDQTASVGLQAVGGLPRAARRLFAILSQLRYGQLEIVTPEGQSFTFRGAQAGPDASLELSDWDVCTQILRSGDIGFAETYLAGRWVTPDLPALLSLAALNNGALEDAIYGKVLGKILYRLRHLLRVNTRVGSKRNIHAHYDLGNAFYQHWLDSTMTYSAALFTGDLGRSLEDAQTAKYERILRLLEPRPGSRILEIGCGWGGFAEYAARTRGCLVHGITIARRQLEFAQQRIHAAGLDDRVTLAFCDYRDVQGRYDHVVSIEMYEAVGERFWPLYFRSLRERLELGGRAVLQAITIADERFERYRHSTDFIQQFIFPGGMLASPSVLHAQAERAGLAVRSTYAFGLDYAETLKRWNQRFDQAWAEIQPLGFDSRFKRLWNFYLSYCEAGFRSGSTDVLQIEMSHA